MEDTIPRTCRRAMATRTLLILVINDADLGHDAFSTGVLRPGSRLPRSGVECKGFEVSERYRLEP